MLNATGNNAYNTQQKNSVSNLYENGFLFKVVLTGKKVQSYIVLCFLRPFETHLPHKIPSSEGSKYKLAMLIIAQLLATRKYTRPSATFHLA